MSDYSTIDRKTLKWVNKEVESTLEQARDELGVFETSDNQTTLYDLSSHLHQIVGSLQMLELKSLSSLVMESELLIEDFIASHRPIAKSSFLTYLNSTFTALQQSLQKIEQGLPENPIPVVELINQIRAIRGLDAIEISSLFSPMIDVFPTLDGQTAFNDQEYRQLAAALRRRFQVFLLDWLRDNDETAIDRLRLIADKLLSLSTFGAVARLWWVAIGYVDYVKHNELHNRAVHGRIFRGVDDLLRNLVLQGESALVRDPGEELIKIMLFYIGVGETRTSRMDEIAGAFKLQNYFPALQKLSASVDYEKIQSRLDDFKKSTELPLPYIRQLVINYFEDEAGENETMQELIEQVQIVSQAYQLADLKVVTPLVEQVLEVVKGLRDGTIESSEDTGFHLAAAIIFVEHSLTDLERVDEQWVQNGRVKLRALQALNNHQQVSVEMDGSLLTGSERQALLDVVGAEVEENLKHIEASLETFSADPDKLESIAGIDKKVSQIRGALQVLGEHKIGLLLQLSEDQFAALQAGEIEASPLLIDALAVSIGTMEEYVGGLQVGRRGMDYLLDRSITELEVAIGKKVTRADVETLLDKSSDSLLSWLADQSNFAFFTDLKSKLRDLLTLAKKTRLNDVEELVKEQNRLIDVISQEPAFLTNNITASLQNNMASIAEKVIQLYGTETTAEELAIEAVLAHKSEAIESDDEDLKFHDEMDLEEIAEKSSQFGAEIPNSTEVGKQNAVDLQQVPLVDEAIFEVFVKESTDVLEDARIHYASCQQDPNNRDSIRQLRRTFHTLKGSARMVGLNGVGEIAWFGESLFNYVLDTGKSITDSILEFAGDVLDEFALHNGEHFQNQHLINTAEWGVRTENVDLSEEHKGSSDNVESEVVDLEAEDFDHHSETDSVSFSVIDDQQMREVFVQEATSNLGIISAQLACDPLTVQADDALSISIHTLLGNTRTLGMAELSDALDKAERLCQQKQESGAELDSSERLALTNLVTSTQDCVVGFQNEAPYFSIEPSEWAKISCDLQLVLDQQSQPATDQPLVDRTDESNQDDEPDNSFIEMEFDENIFTAALGPESVAHTELENTELEITELEITESESIFLESDDDSELLVFEVEADDEIELAPDDDEAVSEKPIHDLAKDLAVARVAAVLGDLESVDDLLGDQQPPIGNHQPMLNETDELDGIEQSLRSMHDEQTASELELAESDERLERDKISDDSELADADADTDDDLSDELRQIFLGELGNLHTELDEEIAKLVDLNQTPLVMANLMRHLHTIKGSSLMAEATALGELTHQVEGYLEGNIIHNEAELRGVRKTLESYVDELDKASDSYRRGDAFLVSRGLLDRLGVPVGVIGSVVERLRSVDDDLRHINLRWKSVRGWPNVRSEMLEQYQVLEKLLVEVIELDPIAPIVSAAQNYVENLSPNTPAEFKQSKDLLQDAFAVTISNANALLDGTQIKDSSSIQEQLLMGIAETESNRISHTSTGTADQLDAPFAQQQAIFVPASEPLSDVEQQDLLRLEKGAKDRAAELRIGTDTLDALTNYVGDANMNRSQIHEEVLSAKSLVEGLYENVLRLGQQLRELEIEADSKISSRSGESISKHRAEEFDPLEMDRYTKLQQLSRSLAENVDELSNIQTSLNDFVYRAETSLQKQDRLNRELQDRIMQVRLVSFGGIGAQLRQVVRRTARELNKDVELELLGSAVRLDKTILDGVVPALEHMLRNSVDHGIEQPSIRLDKNKPKTGKIVIECRQVAREIMIHVRDDGVGLDLETIRAKAIEDKLLAKDQPLNREDVLMFISQSGFSTASKLTQISGRGVGMDVVQTTLRRMSGSISYDLDNDKPGSSFTLRLPISLAVSSALFVESGGEQFAIAARTIERVINIQSGDLIDHFKVEQPTIEVDGYSYTLIDLAYYLGYQSKLPMIDGKVAVILVNAGVQNIAVIVERLLDTQEIVVKNLGEHLGRIPIYAGATIRADGKVVLLIDLVGISYYESFIGLTELSDSVSHSIPTVLVVDDSLTVRKAAERDINALGINAVLAKDGLDAQIQLRQDVPDMILLDIEMPRMDGFELLEWVKQEDALKNIPVVIISSRATEKHINKATKLGCNAFLGKPYLLENLVAVFNQYLPLDAPIVLD